MGTYRAGASFIGLVALTALGSSASAAAPAPTAVFPVELYDTSGEGAKAGQTERLAAATAALAKDLAATGLYRPVDLGPFKTEIAALPARYRCGDCWVAVAEKAGARYAVIAVAHKVSTLVQTLTISVADLDTKTFVARAQTQFRGDTEAAYVRAVDFLVKDRLDPR